MSNRYNPRNNPHGRPPEPQFRINQQITAPEVRVVDDLGEAVGVMSLTDALNLAYEKGLDLVEIAPGANPPVVKIISYDKFRYQKEKELKKQKASQKGGELKQIRITAKAAANDLMIKVKKMEELVNDGHKIEIMLALKGREKYNKEWAFKKMDEFLQLIPFEYKITLEPKFGGKGLITQITKK